MKKYYTGLIFMFVALTTTQAQVSATMGAAYAQQTFVNLTDNSMTTINVSDWDIAFTVVGQQDAGISVNEGASYGATPFKVYLTSVSDFSTTITTDMFDESETLKNDESSWTKGALNSMAAAGNALDYGWGTYDTSSHKIEGNKVFVGELRDGTRKKFMITSLSAGVYTLKYADLDGGNEQTKTIDKANYSNTTLAFFSFSSNEVISTPNEWDLLFTRYGTPIQTGGQIVPYTVTGVLSNHNVKVAQIDGVATDDLTLTNFYGQYQDSLKTNLDIIGYDWKSYSFGTNTYSIVENRHYVVEKENGEVYKITFIDFEGKTTGISIFNSTILTNTTDVDETLSSARVQLFPNPTVDKVTLDIPEISSSLPVQMAVYDAAGKILLQKEVTNNYTAIDMSHYATGVYMLRLTTGQQQISKKIQKL